MASKPKKVGYTGLDKLGNTCFMNVVLQVLANTFWVKEFFLGNGFHGASDGSNAIVTKGDFAEKFGEVIRILWSGVPLHRPSTLQQLVTRSDFGISSDPDASKFLEFVLRKLQEDLNGVEGQPFGIDLPTDGTEYGETAIGQFQGYLHSEVDCRECGKTSRTLEPYKVISVPIPVPTCKIPLIFFPKHTENSLKPPVKMCIEVPTKRSQHDIAEEVATRTGIKSIAHLEFVEVREHTLEPLTTHSHYKPSAGKTLYAFEVEEEPVTKLYCKQRLLSPTNVGQSSPCDYCHVERTADDKRWVYCHKCHIIPYCSKECRHSNWGKHKSSCKLPPPEPIGQPFVVSLPTSRLFYQNLYDIMLSYAQLSVNVTTNDSSSTVDGEGSAVESCANKSLFFIKPVDKDGKALVGDRGSRLKANDTGPLKLCSNYLMLDWKNARECSVSNKDLESEEITIPSADVDVDEEINLEACLKVFTKAKRLYKQDSWYCPKCKDHKEADKQVSLWTLPDTLIIQLKRFSFHNAYYRHKREEFVTYPIELEMSKYCTPNTDTTSQLYDLYGVINHHGVLGGGHYTAYARCLNKDKSKEMGWRLMDDSEVSRITKVVDKVVSKSAYVLFYQRCAAQPSLPSTEPVQTAQPSLPSNEQVQPAQTDDDVFGTPQMDRMKKTAFMTALTSHPVLHNAEDLNTPNPEDSQTPMPSQTHMLSQTRSSENESSSLSLEFYSLDDVSQMPSIRSDHSPAPSMTTAQEDSGTFLTAKEDKSQIFGENDRTKFPLTSQPPKLERSLPPNYIHTYDNKPSDQEKDVVVENHEKNIENKPQINDFN